MHKSLGMMLIVGATTLIATHARVQADDKMAGMVAMAPADIKWGDAPPDLVKGAKLVVLNGDPSKDGAFYIVRVKFPANYKIAAHWHPNDENITILDGSFSIGMGDKLDMKTGKAMPAGSFFSMPAKMHHFAYTTGGAATIEIAGIGPFTINYLNPADDPSKAAPATNKTPAKTPPAKK